MVFWWIISPRGKSPPFLNHFSKFKIRRHPSSIPVESKSSEIASDLGSDQFLGTVPWGNISALPTPLLFLFPAWPLLFPPLFHFLCPTNNKRGSRVPNFFPAIGPLQSTGTSCDHKILRCLKLKFWHWHFLERNWPIFTQKFHFRWL